MGLGVAVGAFLKCLVNPRFSGQVRDLAKSGRPSGEKTSAKEGEKEDSGEEQLRKDTAVQLLGLLQKDGRLLDFLNENLEPFSDADIGASVRGIHEGCRSALEKILKYKKVIDQEEESVCKINDDYSPVRVRLTGRVSDQFPLKGSLVHPGWRAEDIKLPSLSKTDRDIIAPAEVEIE